MVTPKISGLEKPEGITFETWADFGAVVSTTASGDQPRFAFLITSLAGRGVAWVESGADVLALAAELEHAAGALRQHGTDMGPDAAGKPN
jgi:hypothetical protein